MTREHMDHQTKMYGPTFSLGQLRSLLKWTSMKLPGKMMERYIAGSGCLPGKKKRSWWNGRIQIKIIKHTSFCLHRQLKQCRFLFALSQLPFKQALETKLALISVGPLSVCGVQNRALSWSALKTIEDIPGTVFGTVCSTYLCDEVWNVGTQNKILEKLSYLEPRNLRIEVRFVWI